VEAVGDAIEASFAAALPVAEGLDLDRPVEALSRFARLGDTAHLVELIGANPLAWRFPAELGLERVNGATNAGCLGQVADQAFVRDVLVPSYSEAIAAGRPVVHRIATVANGVFLSYRRMTIPLLRTSRSGRATHLLLLTRIDLAIPQKAPPGAHQQLTSRERQCLSLAAAGCATKQIAGVLGLSEKTVEFHLAGIRRKLGARTIAQAVATALLGALSRE
jgi:DNA-binding CsgD family transcriptional regulator